MEKKDVMVVLLGENYPTPEELRYDKKVGLLYTKEEAEEFFREKRKLLKAGDEHFFRLELKADPPLFFVEGKYLLSLTRDYLTALLDDRMENDKMIFERNMDNILFARIFSEVEGTLAIENVSTTRRKIERILKAEKLTEKNDIIVKNMTEAILYILQEKPAFNKENLRKLYSLLSDRCLDEDTALKKDAYYRDAPVYIGAYEGARVEDIEPMMDSLFAFASNIRKMRDYSLFLPLIAHYYILYVHPYFDYNGRTARMVSFWLSVICEIQGAPLFISEAINEEKKEYYRAIINTRNTDNDLTYFLGYIFETAIQYSLIYKNLEEMRRALEKEGIFLSSRENLYLKKILIHSKGTYFNAKMFAGYIQSEVSRQAISKILSGFVSYGVLEKTVNKKSETIYRINPTRLRYQKKD